MTPSRRSAWIDGRLVPVDEPQLLVSDRGFQLGDGLFETLRARRGVVIEWDEHAARLAAGAQTLEIPIATDPATLHRAIGEVLAANDLAGSGDGDGDDDSDNVAGDASVRITVSRGSLDARGTLPPGWRDAKPTIVIQAWPHLPPSAEVLERGLRAVISTVRRDPASPLAGVKTTSRSDSVFARLEAEGAGVEEALFQTTDGRLVEATSANLYAIRGDRLVTPPLDTGVLPGTTRTWLVNAPIAADLNLTVEEAYLTPDDLAGADEAFLSSSVAGILPLVEIDGRSVGGGRPGPRTLALREARERWVDEVSLAAIGTRA